MGTGRDRNNGEPAGRAMPGKRDGFEGRKQAERRDSPSAAIRPSWIAFFVLLACPLFLCSVFIYASPAVAEKAVSVGYGFGAWDGSRIGHVEENRPYNYERLSYLYERPLTPSIVLEPFLAVVNRPATGTDAGFTINAKAYLPRLSPDNRFYFIGGAGAAYTTVKFTVQGTHCLFVLQGGIGFRRGRFLIERTGSITTQTEDG